MNFIKPETVLNALKHCLTESCEGCPYVHESKCKKALYKDTRAVIALYGHSVERKGVG
jgi:hypothetical protein